MPGAPSIWELVDLATPWCVHVAVTLRVAEHIEAGNTDIADLAKAAGADADALTRVVRHLISKGLFEEPAPGRFVLNDAARQLMAPPARFGMNLDGFGGRMAHAWGSMLEAVRTGEPAYHTVFGRPFWDDLAAHPAVAADFDALMGPGHGTPDPDVLPNRDWDSIRTVVDVGGGSGALLAEVLKAHSHLRGTLVDMPQTVAKSADVFRAAGVSDRADATGQSFFDPLPAGADLYMLKSVLADWNDRDALRILTRCADAARPNGRVLAVNGVSPDEERPDPSLLMLVLVGGKTRTLTEFTALAARAGLTVGANAKRPPAWRFLVECRADAARDRT